MKKFCAAWLRFRADMPEGKVCLWDLDSPYYSRAHLYVAATRVKHGSLLIVVD